MKRYILTGAPGAGKTAILRTLEVEGHAVIEEAATDVHALAEARGVDAPWLEPGFVDSIVELQRLRQERAGALPDRIQIFDRSPICTYALARFLDFPVSEALKRELDRVAADGIYQRRVFFVESLGFITPTAARRISLEDALRFGKLHEEAYRAFGYDCRLIAPGPLADRAAAIRSEVKALEEG